MTGKLRDWPADPIFIRSYAVTHDGGRITVSHGQGAKHAEVVLDVMLMGIEPRERGVEPFGPFVAP